MSENPVVVRFDEQHMKELEGMFRLTDEQRTGLDVIPETVADILNTFNWAMHEGDSTICYDGFPEADRLIEWIRNFCKERHIEHDICLEDGFHNLYLP